MVLWAVELGSPPPTRGTLISEYFTKIPIRLTPAYAGNTRGSRPRLRRSQAHPRLRGEHLRYGPGVNHDLRLTPAYAGNTVYDPGGVHCGKAHPRLRGEHKQARLTVWSGQGSPPPTRGTLFDKESTNPMFRLTPAYAGNTRMGLPLRTPPRLTPAYAGNTLRFRTGRLLSRAHPRLRGEHSPSDKNSEPLVRLTPAYAGNTLYMNIYFADREAHPRLRGEHGYNEGFIDALEGSPPPTRGTQKGIKGRRRPVRLTPAYAGNTSSERLVSGFKKAHPRLRGEHY